MKRELFDLDVQVRSVSSVQPDTYFPETELCIQTRDEACFETVNCPSVVKICVYTLPC